MTHKKNIFYAQSGGMTAVINASACAVIETCRKNSDRLGAVYIGKNGIIGALQEELIDTSQQTDEAIRSLKYAPAGVFGSCRYKLKDMNTNRSEYERLIQIFKVHNIGYFIYNGGGDSADTCHKLSQLFGAINQPIQAIHIPKTIDNDLPETDSCPGFGSVAKYIAISTLEASLDLRAMAKTSTKVFILEVMGRHTGWIATAAGLVESHYNIPLLILLPEVPFDQKKFIETVKNKVRIYGYCTVVVSEGTRDPKGQFLCEQNKQDAFGHAQLGGAAPIIANIIQQTLDYKCHWAVADYLQRAARHIASKTDVAQAYALGKASIEFILTGKNAIMPSIRRLSSQPYRWEIGSASLDKIANVERKVPMEFICDDGFGVTAACLEYLQPLIIGEDYPPYKNGLPDYVQLTPHLLEKKLPVFDL